ncbi:MAG: hypothetical protein IKH78_08005 [Ruminococcus sp.]|nr:hypothetical protein [Ruminococcus sp.]
MNKKLTGLLLVLVSIGFIVIGGRYIIESGLFRGYPEAVYLSGSEADKRPAYRLMDDGDKAVYTALYNGISERKEDIPLPKELDGKDYSRIYCTLEKQEGSFFYLDSVYYTAQKVREARIVYRNTENIDGKVEALDKEVAAAVYGAAGVEGGYYLARYINDYIVKKCTYVTGEDSEFASTAYGCLVEGEANCEGYAKAFNMIAAELGLESVVITGTTNTGENHAWNQVRIGLEWYNIDVTWADTDIDGVERQMYFLVNDEDFSKTHIADKTLFEPFKCDGDKWNYYVRNGFYADSLETAEDIVIRELNAGKMSVEIKFASPELYDRFKKEVISRDHIFDLLENAEYNYGSEVTVSLKENERECCLTLKFS